MQNKKADKNFTIKHKGATMWLRQMRDGAWGVGDVVHDICDYLAAGARWRSKYDNAAPLVDFAIRWGVDDALDADAQLLPYCIRQIDSITARLADATDAVRAQHICAMMHNDPCSVRYADVYRLLSDHWDDLCQWSITYRLLAAMAAMQQWCDDDVVQAELQQIVTDMASAWHD